MPDQFSDEVQAVTDSFNDRVVGVETSCDPIFSPLGGGFQVPGALALLLGFAGSEDGSGAFGDPLGGDRLPGNDLSLMVRKLSWLRAREVEYARSADFAGIEDTG